MKFCVPPVRAFKATHNFRLLLTSVSLASLLLVLIPLGYTIVKFVCQFVVCCESNVVVVLS